MLFRIMLTSKYIVKLKNWRNNKIESTTLTLTQTIARILVILQNFEIFKTFVANQVVQPEQDDKHSFFWKL